MAERIAKFISSSGYCSRRAAEKLIEQGKVKIDGNIIDTPATLVDENSVVEVEGKKLEKISNPKIWALYKPVGYVCTSKDEKGRPTIYDLLPAELKNIHYIGRLDMNSEGLLLLTDSGEVKRFYEHPSNSITRVYLVRIFGKIPNHIFTRAEKGIAIKDKESGKIMTYHANIEPYATGDGRNNWLKFTLKEGKNREIRRICEHFGLTVSRLKRISFGDFQLNDLQKGEFKEI